MFNVCKLVCLLLLKVLHKMLEGKSYVFFYVLQTITAIVELNAKFKKLVVKARLYKNINHKVASLETHSLWEQFIHALV